MAHVKKVDRPKPWVVSWRVNGKYRSKAFTKKIDADAFRDSIETAKRGGLAVDPHQGRVSLGEWSEEWLRIATPDLKPKTVATYRSLLDSRILPTFGTWPISTLGPGDVDDWIAVMRVEGLSPSRIRQAHVVLLGMLELAHRQNRIPRNVARGTPLPRMRRKEAAYLDPSTVDRLVEAAGRYGTFLTVQGVLGLRVGEAAALRRRSVDLLHGRIHVTESLAEVGGRLSFGPTKSHSHRKIPIPPTMSKVLDRHLAEEVGPGADALLFTSSAGTPIRYRNFHARVWRPLLERSGLPPCGLHVLRHSAAARMIKAGWNPKAVQTTLGHASAAFTLTAYGHLFDDDLDDLGRALDRISGGTEGVQTLPRVATSESP